MMQRAKGETPSPILVPMNFKSMKTLLLLEPPYAIYSLEVEELALQEDYYYLSLSDLFMQEAGSKSALGQSLGELDAKARYKQLMQSKLRKLPRNIKAGWLLDPDCISSLEEAQALKELLEELNHPLDAIIIGQATAENLLAEVPDYEDKETAAEEIKDYFVTLLPGILQIFPEVPQLELSEQDDWKALHKQIRKLLRGTTQEN
ncbi:hypothetical protein SapgrDRAFT_0210 [Saprospira grandis DSM 2844]|uniref:Uncharacterized protein n=2 Tax=Saprospira TaxID=1007 RepID=J1I120_9BACT|nr:hypothetical protein SapgrDRAFT_0210 [Saprospira grandis DSM 2844]